ncbi:MAG: glycosyltransferase family 4 protein [Phycisphaerales bacterium]
MRVLLIAEEANPEWTSVPLVGWSHAMAISRQIDAHLVTQVRNADAIARTGLSPDRYTVIDSERVARRLYKVADILRGGSGKGWTTMMAFNAVAYRYFERLLWQRFGAAIAGREFDLVHRLTPLSPTIPSPIAARCATAGVPFVLGPLNGGVPWPRGFDSQRRKEREWLSYVRGLHRLMPRYASTRRHAKAIMVASRDTLAQMPEQYRSKCVLIPENAVEPARFPAAPSRPPPPPLRIAFVGRLVPYKGADMLLLAAAELVRAGRATVDIIGDGPEMPRLRQLVADERLTDGVRLDGWVDHAKLAARLGAAHILGFPSIREFGGAVVLEAMALGVVPVVVNYGGPGELVTPETGVAIPIAPRDLLIVAFRTAFERLLADPASLAPMAARARAQVLSHHTWDARASQTIEVYRWALGQRARPTAADLFPARPVAAPRPAEAIA